MKRILMLASALMAAAASADEFILAAKGKPTVAVVVSTQACASVRESAAALAGMLGRIIGAPVAVETGDGTAGIVIGMPSDFPALRDDPTLKLAERVGDTNDLAVLQSYVLRSHPKGIAVIGASELAVEYAAWDLLHRLGYRHFFPHEDWEIVPALPDAALAVDAFEKPDYADRRIWYGFGGDGVRERVWNFRNRMNQHGWRSDWRPAMPARWKTTLVNAHHAYHTIITENKELFAAHPEYLALVSSNRVGSKLCISNTNVPPLALRYALGWFAAHPDSFSVSMEPTDGYGWCECTACAALGSPSTRAVFLANFVAKGLESSHPDKWVGMLAYAHHAEPPAIPVHPRVWVQCATQLSGDIPVEERLRGWGEKGAKLGVYDYYGVAQWHVSMPGRMKGGDLAFLAKSLPEFHRLGARLLCAESADAWGPNGLGYYLASRMMWSTNESSRLAALTDDFLVRAFGKGAGPMREFYALMDNSRNAETGGGRPGSVEYFENRYKRMDRALVAAAEAAGDDPGVQARLDHLFVYARYVQLWCALKRAEKAGGAGHEAMVGRQEALERLIRFAYRTRETGMCHWDGLRNVIAGAGMVDLKAPPSWLTEDEKAALELKGDEAVKALVKEWAEVTPALRAEVRAEAKRVAAEAL